MKKCPFGSQDGVFTEGKVTGIDEKWGSSYSSIQKCELASDMVPKHVEDSLGSLEPKTITYGPIQGVAKFFSKILFSQLSPTQEPEFTEGKVTKMGKWP